MARRPTAYARSTDERQNERARERSTGPITIPRLGNSFPDVFYIPGTDLVLTQPRTELICLIPGNSRSREFPPVPNIWLSHIFNHTHRCQLHRAKTITPRTSTRFATIRAARCSCCVQRFYCTTSTHCLLGEQLAVRSVTDLLGGEATVGRRTQ